MPTLPGIGPSQFFISDLAQEVILKAENRTTDLARAYVWVRDALLEIAGNQDLRDEFDELEILGSLVLLTPGVQEYPFGNFLVDSNDINMATLDIKLWYLTGYSYRLGSMSYQESDTMGSQSGIPTRWYRFGDTLGFDITPDQAYQVQARILRMHPINDDNLSATPVLLPRDWHIIIVIAAVEHAFIELNEYEKAGAVHQLLYGDPKNPGKPGMIESRKKRRQREGWRSSVSLSPIAGRYSAR